ncbi:MAG: ABC transporter permease [Sphaerochaetaceae bacterium]|jgi:peptide/nickel transport system permease protein|nr:ABC transporter permease [Sphaerochaetaceae bacterium]MDD2406737.1 ABC transporter permease [Sphaerochaetaceae bacterium]MDD4260169.1 ABC transporter permease [Sphaerochaetaceae bacterium]NLO61548.1 ABC transporter permease [Spirochaetales bacterium]
MLKYFFRRLLSFIPKILIITILIFIGLEFVPGDPISYLIPPEQMAFMTEETIANMRENLGLNDPAYIRYFKWLGNILKGDMGYSLINGVKISDIIWTRLPATIELTALGFAVATILGLLFGFISALKRNTPIDYSLTALGMVGVSIPEFFFGLSAIVVFGLTFRWLPPGGRMTPGQPGFFQRIPYLVMPVLVIGISYTATLMRYTRGSMLDTMNKDYVKAARSKGLSETRVNLVHSFRNAIIPVMIIIVNRIPILIAGTVVIESVFNYPGMGKLILESISGSDMPVVMIATFFIALAVLIASFLVDLLSALLDPRIRFGKM